MNLACRLQSELRSLTRAAADPRTPRRAKWLVARAVAYAVSPIDLIPDFLPVLGHLDDLMILPLAVWMAVRMIPHDVMVDCRATANGQAGR